MSDNKVSKRLRELAAGRISGEIPVFEYDAAADEIDRLSQPAPASTGLEADHCAHVWNDFGQLGGRNVSWCPRCDTLAWTGKEPEPVAARELDVEAERRVPVTDPVKSIITGVREFYLGLLSSHLPPKAFDQARADDMTQVAYQGVADRFLALVKSVAGQSTAPVSTEQAGDAWQVVPKEMTMDMHVAFAEVWFSKVRPIDDHDMQDAYAAMLGAAPSPNNSPVGGED